MINRLPCYRLGKKEIIGALYLVVKHKQPSVEGRHSVGPLFQRYTAPEYRRVTRCSRRKHIYFVDKGKRGVMSDVAGPRYWNPSPVTLDIALHNWRKAHVFEG